MTQGANVKDSIRDHGIVGCGGAGFPTAVKLSSRAGTLLVNAAECEPLLHKDKELLEHRTADFVAGLRIAMDRVGAQEAIIGLKAKYSALHAHLAPHLPANVRIHPLPDVYPMGDEFVLVFEATGRIIPPGCLPLSVGCVVCNVETLVHIGADRPFTRKYVTVAGAVARPLSCAVPVGTRFSELIHAAGGSTVPRSRVLVGGVMMGRLAHSLEEPVTKTTGGLIVLPGEHPLLERYGRTPRQSERIGRSACDQCSFCTELCPRYLLGHPVEPHKAMRALGFSASRDLQLLGGLYCCECNLCSLISCPEGLDPREACINAKRGAREKGMRWTGAPPEKPHPMNAYRRTPTARIFQRLALDGFENHAPLAESGIQPNRVVLPLQQHLGAPSLPVVKPGDRVREGALVAEIPEGKLGARVHASIEGTVIQVDANIVIERS
jgi:Na+-translocating ferredoxin:NAD+ oxidoreductase RnfC subunit